MIGDDYINQRAELGTSLFVLGNLAREAGVQVDITDLAQQLHDSLQEPFLFVVVGEVKAGKSSLLNALFGREFCRADVLPATDKITVFKYGEKSRDETLSDTVVEAHRPIGFLRDFHIVDTPGTNTIAIGHEAITNRYLPMADLILFVFSITNPWAASAWEFLDQLQNKWLKNIAFIVQQIDLREPMEVQAVVDHLRETSLQRLGRECPIFAVSAKSAFMSKTTGVDKERLWKESRFASLEKYINDTVSGGEGRHGKLLAAANSTLAILEQVRETLRRDHRDAEADLEQVAALRKTTAWTRDQTARHIGEFIARIEEAVDQCRDRQTTRLRQQLGFFPTIGLGFGATGWQTRFANAVENDLTSTLHEQFVDAAEQLQGELDHVWEQLNEALHDGIKDQSLLPEPGAPAGFRLDDNFVESLEHKLERDTSRQTFREALQAMTRQTARWVQVAMVSLLLGGGALAAQILELFSGADLVAVCGGLGFVFGSVVATTKRRDVLELFQHHMRLRSKEIFKIVEKTMDSAAGEAYDDFYLLLRPLSEHYQSRQDRLEPLVARAADLEQTLDRLLLKLGGKPELPATPALHT